MGNESSSSGGSSRGSSGKIYEGYGGTSCSTSDISKATSAMNSLNDTSGWGNQVAAAITSNKVNYACAAENIKGPTPNK